METFVCFSLYFRNNKHDLDMRQITCAQATVENCHHGDKYCNFTATNIAQVDTRRKTDD